MTEPLDPVDSPHEIAVHESGHALMAARLGLGVRGAALRDNGGVVVTGPGPDVDLDALARYVAPELGPIPQPARPLDCVLMLVAGPAALARFRKRRFSPGATDAFHDVLAAERILARLTGRPPWHWSTYARVLMAADEAARRLHLDWEIVLRTAQALVERRRLSGAEIRELVEAPRLAARSVNSD